jgi:hypothetical protein
MGSNRREIEWFPPGAICRITEMTSWKTLAVSAAEIVILWTLLSAFQPVHPEQQRADRHDYQTNEHEREEKEARGSEGAHGPQVFFYRRLNLF